jgi:Tol biopolymer transport system component
LRIALGDPFQFQEGIARALAALLGILPPISLRGRHLAFAASNEGRVQLWVRDLDLLAAGALPGAEGANDPFWSPDSRAIAFFARGKLRKADLAAGPPMAPGWGAAGLRRRVELNGSDRICRPLYRVSPEGAALRPVTKLDASGDEVSQSLALLPAERPHFLYTSVSSALRRQSYSSGGRVSGDRSGPGN